MTVYFSDNYSDGESRTDENTQAAASLIGSPLRYVVAKCDLSSIGAGIVNNDVIALFRMNSGRRISEIYFGSDGNWGALGVLRIGLDDQDELHQGADISTDIYADSAGPTDVDTEIETLPVMGTVTALTDPAQFVWEDVNDSDAGTYGQDPKRQFDVVGRLTTIDGLAAGLVCVEAFYV